MKMDKIEFARRLAQVQDELETLADYLEHNSVIDELQDNMLFGLIYGACILRYVLTKSYAPLRVRSK